MKCCHRKAINKGHPTKSFIFEFVALKTLSELKSKLMTKTIYFLFSLTAEED